MDVSRGIDCKFVIEPPADASPDAMVNENIF
jgi:hypothetical protein